MEPQPALPDKHSAGRTDDCAADLAAASFAPASLKREVLTDQLRRIQARSVHSDLSGADQSFLEHWSAALAAPHLKPWLLSWVHALKAYGTDLAFMDGLTFRTVEFEVNGRTYAARSSSGGNYGLRAALMRSQRPYAALAPDDAYGLHLQADCFLCDNVKQSIDASRAPGRVADNTVLPLVNDVLLPNRYPGFPLHLLLVPMNHDDQTARIAPRREELPEGGARKHYPPAPGRTRGQVLTAGDLSKVMQLSDAIGLVAIRNHVLDGMSIPGHDHWHFHPEAIYPSGFFKQLYGSDHPRPSAVHWHRVANTPFDTLALTGPSPEAIARTAAPIFERLERDNQVFTLAYAAGHLLASLRRPETVQDRFLKVGGGLPVHFIDTDLELILKHAYLRGTAPWERYIGH